ncbi:MAG TPA: glycine cleavage system H protein [Syntrophomonas sp.]|mgnify:CR=1 FL=1|nr:glycine cleavage system H protein [Syntrophomonas sp.]
MQVDKYQIPEKLFYDRNDFWIKVNGAEALVGMTDFGQSNTGDILYLELLNSGESLSRGERCGSIESGKWVGNLTAPVSGAVVENNSEVVMNPRKINADAYGEGWMYRIKLSNPDEVKSLMTAADYAAWVVEQIKTEEELN